MKHSILETFNKFAHREVAMDKSGLYVAQNDATIAEIHDEAAKNGLTLRVWTPGMMGTMDLNDHRLNVVVEQDADKKFRTRRFYIG